MMNKINNFPLYLSKPGVNCAAGSSAESLFDSACTGNQNGLKTVETASHVTFTAARIDENLIKKTNDEYDMRIIQIEDDALAQIADYVESAKNKYGADRIAVCVGSCDNGSALSLEAHKKYFADGAFPAGYTLVEQSAQYPALYAAKKFSVTGPVIGLATACSSSAGAFVKASELIRAGFADAAIVGGADVASDTVLLGFNSLGAVASGKTNPFSKNRCGITLGEGAAFFVLSKEPLAVSGNNVQTDDAPAIELLGTGESSDASHMTAPLADGSGAKKAMEDALKNAGLIPSQIDYVNLHGTGTPLNDSMESKATAAVFGERGVKASTTKPLTGHTLGAAGAVELAVCWMAIMKNKLPVQVWDGERDPEIPELDFVTQKNNNGAHVRICMSNSFAFGGCNTSLIIGRK